MSLNPVNEGHALQIQAGTLGRKAGHQFEDYITSAVNNSSYPIEFDTTEQAHVRTGDPAQLLLSYIAQTLGFDKIVSASALSTGALATTTDGKKWLEVNGVTVRRCKSDIIVSVGEQPEQARIIGVSTKQCNNKRPTNAQLFFTTARGFVKLLNAHEIPTSNKAVKALRQFCGDASFRPLDDEKLVQSRSVDPRRFFWEEVDTEGRRELEWIFTTYQDKITRLLLQKAYLGDPFTPDVVLHKTKRVEDGLSPEVAIYTVDELVHHSSIYGGFNTKSYSIRKGSYRDPDGVTHLAPRFGIVQMQRGGQAQHPEQLQFNLEAGYFYKIGQHRPNVLRNSAG